MFDASCYEKLGHYVYALFDSGDPRWPFYIGKGQGNRIFSHTNGVHVLQSDEDPMSEKLELIADIREAGRVILHKIIRFGLLESEAFKIEASLIDLVNYIKPDQLRNIVSGQGVSEGFFDANDLAFSLRAKELIPSFPILVIKIERRWAVLYSKYGSASLIPASELFDATKGEWKLNVARAKKAGCVLAVARGLVRAAFVPSDWEDVGNEKRKKMTGLLDASKYESLVGTSVAHIFQRGSQNPVRYLGYESDMKGLHVES